MVKLLGRLSDIHESDTFYLPSLRPEYAIVYSSIFFKKLKFLSKEGVSKKLLGLKN